VKCEALPNCHRTHGTTQEPLELEEPIEVIEEPYEVKALEIPEAFKGPFEVTRFAAREAPPLEAHEEPFEEALQKPLEVAALKTL
jgi:hypothetical protein